MNPESFRHACIATGMAAILLLAGCRAADDAGSASDTGPDTTIETRTGTVRLQVSPAPGLEAADIERIAGLLRADAAFARDVVFLLVASLRERCQPAHAGELAMMANRARLPVLAATAAVTADAPELDRPIYLFLQSLADTAPCSYRLDLNGIGPALTIDPDGYAATFPDSYYQPTLRQLPDEYQGMPLGARARQGCQSLAYAVFRLDEPDWRCHAIWSSARLRTLQACEDVRRQVEPGSSSQVEIPVAVAEAVSTHIEAIADGLPMACRLR